MTPASLASDPVAGALLAGAVDYAGLFPPASLDLPTTLEKYLEYRASRDAWAIGRLVMPTKRLPELASLLPKPDSGPPVEIAALVAAGTPEEAAGIADFNREASRHGAAVTAMEVAPGVAPSAQLVSGIRCYFEVPIGQVNDATIAPVEAVGGSVKLRTGGTTAAAFPSVKELARALALLGSRRLSFKATAGLHHPLAGSYRLTYADGAPTGTMFGYLNVMMASLLAWGREEISAIEAALTIDDAGALTADDRGLRFLERRYPIADVEEMRRDFFHGFGSCSFREPVDEWPLSEVR